MLDNEVSKGPEDCLGEEQEYAELEVVNDQVIQKVEREYIFFASKNRKMASGGQS